MGAEPAGAEAAARLALFEVYRAQRACVWVDATGSSMRPWIRTGTSLNVDFGARDASVGEVVLFARGTRIVAHRVVRRLPGPQGPVLATKGDSSLRFDAPVPVSELLGIVRGLRRAPGRAVTSRVLSGRSGQALAAISRAAGRLYAGLHRIAS